jgi:branched-subunit amino acid aminotransferase/4-amino-4-deoxychorismate lyase
VSVVLCNGRIVEAGDCGSAAGSALHALALRNYGHFTSMQVRGGAVRGLDLHLRRLREATRDLFATELDDQRVLDGLRRGLDAVATADCSARVTICAAAFDFRDPLRAVDVDVIVSISAPAEAEAEPRRVKSFHHERALPHVKHVGTFPLFHFARAARGAGFDDALFVTHDGRLSEGSVWNLGLWDGRQVTWPLAPALRATSEQLLQAGLDALGVAQARREVRLEELAGFRAGFACNSRGVWPLAGVDEMAWPPAPDLAELLAQALARHPWQPV